MARTSQAKRKPVTNAQKARGTSRPPQIYAELQSRQRGVETVVASVAVERAVPWWQISALAVLAVIIWNGKNLPLPSFHFASPAVQQFSAISNVPSNAIPAQSAPQPVAEPAATPSTAPAVAPLAVPAVQAPDQPVPTSQNMDAVEKSYKYAADSGLLRAVFFACTVKQAACNYLLAIAKLESDMGRNTGNDRSSARGVMQIIHTEFIRMVKSYGARNVEYLAAYLSVLPPQSHEAETLRRDIVTLQTAIAYMGTHAYHKSRSFPGKLESQIIKLNNQPVIQMLFVVDRLIDDNAFLVNRLGVPREDCLRYAYVAYVYGPAAADIALTAYLNPELRNRPVAPLLTALYARYDSDDPEAKQWAKQLTHATLVNNGQKMNTTVGQFIDARVAPFLQLSNEYAKILKRSDTPVASL